MSLKFAVSALFVMMSFGAARGADSTMINKDSIILLKKNWTANYLLTAGCKLRFRSGAGKMEVHTWRKRTAKVEYHVLIKAYGSRRAAALFSRINFHEERSDTGWNVWVKGPDHNVTATGDFDKEDYSVRCDIYAPADADLALRNAFGAIVIGDFEGPLKLDCAFDTIRTGRLAHLDSLNIGWGAALIESARATGPVSAAWSMLKISSLSGSPSLSLTGCGAYITLDTALRGLKVVSTTGLLELNCIADFPASFNIRAYSSQVLNGLQRDVRRTQAADDSNPVSPAIYSGKMGDGHIPIDIIARSTALTLQRPMARRSMRNE